MGPIYVSVCRLSICPASLQAAGQRRASSVMGGDYGSLVSSAEPQHQSSAKMLPQKRTRAVLIACVAGLMAVVALSSYSLSEASMNSEFLLAQGASQVSLVDVSAMQRAKPEDQVSFEDLSSMSRAQAATSAAQKAPTGPLPVGQVLRVDMPASQMQSLKVGSIVKGQVRRPMLAADGQEEFNTLDFTGKVRTWKKKSHECMALLPPCLGCVCSYFRTYGWTLMYSWMRTLTHTHTQSRCARSSSLQCGARYSLTSWVHLTRAS
jgi:hypothetical protein